MDEYQGKQRIPTDRDFDALESREFKLDARLYICITSMLPREPILAEDVQDVGVGFEIIHKFGYEEAWTDEEFFYKWLMGQSFPKELARFLYEQTPEITLKAGALYLYGVRDLIELNESSFAGFIVSKSIRQAGFLIVGLANQGTLVVMDLVEERGRICYIKTNEQDEMSVIEIRNSLIVISDSIGSYIAEFEKEEPLFAVSYDQAGEMSIGGELDYSPRQDLQNRQLAGLWAEFIKLLAKLKQGYYDRMAEHEVAQMDLHVYTKKVNVTLEPEDENIRIKSEERCKLAKSEQEKAELYYARSLIMRERYSQLDLTLDRKNLIDFDVKELRGYCKDLEF